MAQLDMLEMHGIKLEIDITPSGAATWAELSEGIDNMQEALNEVVNQFKFMADEGFSRSRVSGMAPVWTVSGRRIFGDAAQDFIFARKYMLGSGRETSARVTWAAGGNDYSVTFDCAFANLAELGGATTDNPAITIEIHVNGKPTLTVEPSTPTLEVSSIIYNVTQPVKLATPQSTHAAGTGYTATITWTPADAAFAAATAYTAIVVYTAATGYEFDVYFGDSDVTGLPTALVADDYTVTRTSDTQIVISVTYVDTAA